MLAEKVEAASPEVLFVLIQADRHPFRSKGSNIELEADLLAQAVGAVASACGIGIRDTARGSVVSLSELSGGDEGEGRLGFDAGAKVDEAVEQLAGKLDSEVNAVQDGQ